MTRWLQAFAAVNTVELVTTAVCEVLDGTMTAGEVGLGLLGPAIVTAVCAPLAMALYRRER